MLRNYITIAIRHLTRQAGYTTLNILGLTLGLVSSLLIILYLTDELSFDKSHIKADRIYRISSDITEPDNSFRWAVTQMPLGKTLKSEISEVEQSVRLISNGRTRFDIDGIFYFEEDIYYTDSTVFDVFTYAFIQGNPETALDAPNSIVLNKSLADKLFKGKDPLGQIIKADDMTLSVTGVYKDLPKSSHIQPIALISASTEESNSRQNWGNFGIYTYVLLQEGADPAAVTEKLDGILEKYVAVIFDQFDVHIKYELINIKAIHLKSTFQGEPEPLGNMKYIYIFGAIALFLILIACINYMNLATARSIKRSLEVGVRKVMGAQRSSLALQFITESILITLASFLLGLILLIVILPAFNSQLDLSLSLSNLFQPQILLLVAAIILITGLISGSYPAFVLSSVKPVIALKGKGSRQTSNHTLRRILVAMQFSITIFMLIGTLVIYQQMQFLRDKDLGFDKEKTLRVALDNQAAREKYPVFKTKLESNPSISLSSTSSSVPGSGFGKNLIKVETKDGVMEDYGVDLYFIDYDYFTLLNIPFAHGRNFSTEYVTDTASAVIVNEAMVRRMNWDDPIGKKFQFNGDSLNFQHVVGVVKDFHQQSLYKPIEALLFIPRFNNGNMLIKMNGDAATTISSIENSWNEVFPGVPFEYTFLDADFMDEYKTDQLRGKLFLGFSLMMIFIACLGLLGLASFIAEQRTKEISIRKVLGAKVGVLVALLVKDFLVLVLFGAVPAFGLSYYFMNEWLTNFEYHVEINFLLFFIVLIVIGIITLITTGYHAYRAANANPSDKLRYE